MPVPADRRVRDELGTVDAVARRARPSDRRVRDREPPCVLVRDLDASASSVEVDVVDAGWPGSGDSNTSCFAGRLVRYVPAITGTRRASVDRIDLHTAGGGIEVAYEYTGGLSVTDSTITGTCATCDGVYGAKFVTNSTMSGYGIGIHYGQAITNSMVTGSASVGVYGVRTIANSTVSGNGGVGVSFTQGTSKIVGLHHPRERRWRRPDLDGRCDHRELDDHR